MTFVFILFRIGLKIFSKFILRFKNLDGGSKRTFLISLEVIVLISRYYLRHILSQMNGVSHFTQEKPLKIQDRKKKILRGVLILPKCFHATRTPFSMLKGIFLNEENTGIKNFIFISPMRFRLRNQHKRDYHHLRHVILSSHY